MPLELVHTNVCYVDTKWHVGSQYFVTFIDNYSRKLWASMLKDEGSDVICLQRVPRDIRLQRVPSKGQEGNRSKVEGSPSGKWWRVPRTIQRILPSVGNPT